MNPGQTFTTSAGTFKIDENGMPVKIEVKGINGGDIKRAGDCDFGDIISISAKVIEQTEYGKDRNMVALEILNNPDPKQRLFEINAAIPVEVNIPKSEMVKGERMTAREIWKKFAPAQIENKRYLAIKVSGLHHEASEMPIQIQTSSGDDFWFYEDDELILLPEGFGNE